MIYHSPPRARDSFCPSQCRLIFPQSQRRLLIIPRARRLPLLGRKNNNGWCPRNFPSAHRQREGEQALGQTFVCLTARSPARRFRDTASERLHARLLGAPSTYLFSQATLALCADKHARGRVSDCLPPAFPPPACLSTFSFSSHQPSPARPSARRPELCKQRAHIFSRNLPALVDSQRSFGRPSHLLMIASNVLPQACRRVWPLNALNFVVAPLDFSS